MSVESLLVFMSIPQHRRVEARLDLHGHKLLEEEFACVGNLHLANAFTRFTEPAVILGLTEIGFAEETALPAYMHTIAVRNIKETFLEESG